MQKVAIGLILTLLIVISLLSQKVEGMGFEVNAANPQYIIIEAYYGWNMLWVKNATDAVGRGTATRRLGISASIFAFDWSDDLIKQELDTLFSASEKNDVPLLLHIDTEHFWTTDRICGTGGMNPLLDTILKTRIMLNGVIGINQQIKAG